MNLINATDALDGVALILIIAIVIVSILIGIAVIASTVFRIIIFFNYWVTNRAKTQGGYTGKTAAEKLLSDLGYTDVKVEKMGFFRMLFYGNHYNPKKKIVYLRKSTYERGNLTSIGLALQKVGLVIQDKKDDKSFKARWKLQQISIFGPILFIPIVLIGVIIDVVTLLMTDGVFTGVGTFIFSLLGFLFFIACFILSLLTIKVESRANKETLKIMKDYDFLTPAEQEKVAKVFKTYILAYITDFIVTLLQIIRLILKIALEIVLAKSRK